MQAKRWAFILLLLSFTQREAVCWATPQTQPHHAQVRARAVALKWGRKLLSQARMKILQREVQRERLDFNVDRTNWVSDGYTLRGDHREAFRPEIVFNQGMNAKGGPTGDVDLVAHVQSNAAISRYVSTTKSLSIAEGFGVKNGKGFVYLIKVKQGVYAPAALQGNARVRNANSVKAQKEVSVLNRVEPHEIRGAFEYTKGSTRTTWIPNPNYR